MCGILGSVLAETSQEAQNREKEWIHKGLRLLSHRGPDADGWIADNTVCLGSRRLRIHDLSKKADQPLECKDGRFVVVFNGAIFNYLELRRQLINQGYHFQTSCDTEVVLYALVEWGTDALNRFDGMYALAWYDRTSRRLLIARDKLGIKPLYFHQNSSFTLFASEIKPILAHPKIERRLNTSVVPEFLAYQFVSPPDTMFEGIQILPPGHMMSFNLENSYRDKEISCYWQLNGAALYDPSAPSVEEALETSIKRAWNADRNSGIQLSGGVDSSLITAISHNSFGMNNINTYSVIFDDSKIKYYQPRSEEAYIQRVSDDFGTNAKMFLFGENQIRSALAEAVWWNEAPLQGPSTCIYMLFARAISEDVKVLLTGEGADDIFLGYFAKWNFGRNNEGLFKFFIEKDRLIQMVGSDGLESALSKRLDLISSPRLNGMTPCQKASVITIETVLHGLLARHDRMFMASSIEGRLPFCTDEILKARFALPDDEIHDGSNGKLVLKKIAERYFDHEFVFRKKIGFSAPFGDWCANEQVWRGYIDAINLDWLSSIIDISPLQLHSKLADSRDKWSMQNLNVVFSVAQLQLMNDIFIDSKDPLSIQSWKDQIPEIRSGR